MDSRTGLSAAAGVVGIGAALAGVWTAVDLVRSRGVERVPYKRVGEVESIEFRRYPETIRVRTTAPTGREAFFRLFRYIDGANAGGEAVAMTAPVAAGGTDGDARDGEEISMTAPVETRGSGATETDGGEAISMTAPVETEGNGDGVTMSFFLPEEYTPETAPEPTEEGVELVVDPPRTLAVSEFSWWTPGVRVAAKRRELAAVLERAGVETLEEPRLLRYDGPGTPPWRRTNEVAVEVASGSVRRALGNGR